MSAEVAHGAERVGEELKRPYVLVLVLLAVVTLAEVQIPSLGEQYGLDQATQIGFLMGSAVVKAGLVALYYMHLRYEPRILRLLPVGPLVFVGLLLAVLVLGQP